MCACGGRALAEFMDLEFGILEEMVRVQRLTKGFNTGCWKMLDSQCVWELWLL